VITPAFFEDKFENGSWKKTISNLPKPTELVTYGISPHAPYTVKEYGYSECEGYSKANDCVLHTHVSETRKEVSDIAKERGMGPVEWLDSIGVLSPRMVAAHCVWADQKEIELLGKRGVSVAHCPVSNMKLASGLAPVPELVAAGANVCLGTDGSASNNSLNMLDTIKICSLAHKNARLDPHIIPAQQALDFATRNGAKALRIDSGSIEEGKLADIVLIDLTAPNLAPGRGYASLVAYSADPSNVHTVIINGKIVLENREFVGIDEEKIVDDAIEAASGLKTE